MVAASAAVAAPTQDDVDRARADVAYAEMSVAQLEIQLAAAASQAEDASIQAAVAAEAANKAQVDLEEATAAAKTAEGEAAKAKDAFDEGRKQLAGVAQVAYREGAGSLDALAPYLEADGLQTIEQKRNAVASFGLAADNQMQQVAALKQVADIMDTAAKNAKAAEEAAYKQVQDKAEAAQAAAASAQEVVSATAAARSAMIEELAQKRQTSVELETQRIQAAEAQREQEAANTVLNGGGSSTSNSGGGSQSTGNSNSNSGNSGDSNSNSNSNSGSGGGTTTPTPDPKPDPTPDPKPTPSKPSSVSGSVIAYASNQIGKPYLWGGTGPNAYDCSGLTMQAFASAGISIPRVASDQYYSATKVPFSQRQPGDLIFWSRPGDGIYHVAIYVGNDQILHARQPGKPIAITELYNWDSIVSSVGRYG